MENIIVDARGRFCPEPVIMTKNAVASKPEKVTVIVDSRTCVENVSRFAKNAGYAIVVSEDGDDFTLTLSLNK